MAVEEALVHEAREAAQAWTEARHSAERAKADYHHAIRRLHVAGASMREIADTLDISHQRVHQIIDASTAEPRAEGEETSPTCAFCERSNDHVGKLVAGPGPYICDGCVTAAKAVADDSETAGPATVGLRRVPRSAKKRCSFCHRRARKSPALVAGPAAQICDQCLDLYADLIRVERVREHSD